MAGGTPSTAHSIETMEIEDAQDRHVLSLCDLPVEILVRLALEVPARDVEALGATCSLLRGVARDDRLWRCLFERDHRALYDRSADILGSPRVASIDEPWPERVLQLIAHEPLFGGRVGTKEWPLPCHTTSSPSEALMPMHLESDRAWLPAPFAHMRAAGKDARWLYIAHAHSLEPYPTSCADWVCRAKAVGRVGLMVGTVRASTLSGKEAFARAFVGDAWATPDDNGKDDGNGGYGVTLDIDCQAGRIMGWLEAQRAERKWSICVAPYYTTALFTLGAEAYLKHTVAVEADSKAWSRMVRTNVRGWWATTHHDGSSCEEVYVDGGGRRRMITAEGATTDYIRDAHGRRTDEGVTEYANGDRVRHTWHDDSLTGIVDFACSPRCTDLEFAGRVIVAPRWGWIRVTIRASTTDYAYWPLDDPDAERVFWRYVEEGHIGWVPPVRRAALDHRNRSHGGIPHSNDAT
jgi:hypothetical protein